MTGYRCDTGACPQVTYSGDTVTIVETANPEQMVVTAAVKWDAYLDTVRAQERAAIVAGLREVIINNPNWADRDGAIFIADLIEQGEIGELAAGDE